MPTTTPLAPEEAKRSIFLARSKRNEVQIDIDINEVRSYPSCQWLIFALYGFYKLHNALAYQTWIKDGLAKGIGLACHCYYILSTDD
jgi:hypothetical protein